MVWVDVIFTEPKLSVIGGDYIYFNAAFRDSVGNTKGMDFFHAIDEEGKEILSCKPGEQFLFSNKKNEYRINCRGLSEYISTVYGSKTRFKAILNDGYWILYPND